MKLLLAFLLLLPTVSLAADTANKQSILYRSMQRERERGFEKMDQQHKAPVSITRPTPPRVASPIMEGDSTRLTPTAPSDLNKPVKGPLLYKARALSGKLAKAISGPDGTCNQKIALQGQVVERQRALIRKLQAQMKSAGMTPAE